MMRTRILLAIFLLMFNSLYAENVDVTVMVPEDYGIDFPSALHIDRLYFAMENEQGDLELLTESDIDVGIVYSSFGTVNLSLLYYGNLSQPYSVQLAVNAGDGFRLEDNELGVFLIPISPVLSLPHLTNLSASDVILSAEENKADLIINPVGPIQGDRVVDIALNWNGGRDLLPGLYTAEVSMTLISE